MQGQTSATYVVLVVLVNSVAPATDRGGPLAAPRVRTSGRGHSMPGSGGGVARVPEARAAYQCMQGCGHGAIVAFIVDACQVRESRVSHKCATGARCIGALQVHGGACVASSRVHTCASSVSSSRVTHPASSVSSSRVTHPASSSSSSSSSVSSSRVAHPAALVRGPEHVALRELPFLHRHARLGAALRGTKAGDRVGFRAGREQETEGSGQGREQETGGVRAGEGVMWYGMLWCGMVWISRGCGAVWCGIIEGAVWYGIASWRVWNGVVWHPPGYVVCLVWCGVVWRGRASSRVQATCHTRTLQSNEAVTCSG